MRRRSVSSSVAPNICGGGVGGLVGVGFWLVGVWGVVGGMRR